MELWEYAACYRGYINREKIRRDERVISTWMTANFSGAAFGGKLKPLKHYLNDNEKISAPKISKEEFEEKLAKAKGMNPDGA